jgi:hypothetical protein
MKADQALCTANASNSNVRIFTSFHCRVPMHSPKLVLFARSNFLLDEFLSDLVILLIVRLNQCALFC